MRSARLLVLSLLLALLPTAGLPSLAVAADPNKVVTLVVTPGATTVGSPVTATATVLHDGSPVAAGRVMFDVDAPINDADWGSGIELQPVVDGVASVTIPGGLAAGDRVVRATYIPGYPADAWEPVQATLTLTKRPTTSTLTIAPYPSRSISTATVDTVTGQTANGECVLAVDGVVVDSTITHGCPMLLPILPPGTHTVTTSFTGDKFGIPSAFQLYQPSVAEGTYVVPAAAPSIPTVTPTPTPVTTSALVSVPKLVTLPKSAVIKLAVKASDGRATNGQAIFKITGARTLKKSVLLSNGKAVLRIKLRPGRYKVNTTFRGSSMHPASTSPTVSFKVK